MSELQTIMVFVLAIYLTLQMQEAERKGRDVTALAYQLFIVAVFATALVLRLFG